MVNKIDAKRFIEILGDAGMAVRKYSGRGMGGVQCVGFENEGQNQYGLIADLVAGADDETERLQLAKVFRGTRSDNMGRSDLIIYFPDIEWPEGVNEADYRDDDDDFEDDDF